MLDYVVVGTRALDRLLWPFVGPGGRSASRNAQLALLLTSHLAVVSLVSSSPLSMASASYLAFEEEVEQHFREAYDGPPPPRTFIRAVAFKDEKDYNDEMAAVRWLEDHLVAGQRSITSMVVEDRATGSQRIKRWLARDPAAQRIIIENALETVFYKKGSPQAAMRQYLPELRFAVLLASHGQGLVDLLEAFCAPGGDGKSVQWLENTRVTEIVGTIR